MTPPPDHAGASVRRPTQPVVERPETPPRVRDKLAEGELLYTRLAGQVATMGARLDALAEGQHQAREAVAEIRGDLRELERRSERRNEATRAEIKAVSGEVGALREDLDKRLDGIERALTFRAGAEAGAGAAVEVPPTQPTLPALHPLTSTGQARRAVAVGGGGVGVGTVLAVVAALGSLPPVVQYVVGGLAAVVILAAVAVAFRWGWRAAGR